MVPIRATAPSRSSALVAAAVLLVSLALADRASNAVAARAPRQAIAHAAGTAAIKAMEPKTGVYEACSIGDQAGGPPQDCGSRLTAIREAGFDLVLNYSTAAMSLQDDLAYADLAWARGLKVVWNLADYRESLGSKLDLVSATASNPATWGYYLGDEVSPPARGQVAELSRGVRSRTTKPTLFVSRPARFMLRPFAKLADYLGPDTYPVGSSDPPVCRTARWSDRLTRNPVIVLQAFSWSIDDPGRPARWPTAVRMRRMREAAMRCGRPKLIFWFCFQCISDYHPSPDSYWRQVAWAANGITMPSTGSTLPPTGGAAPPTEITLPP